MTYHIDVRGVQENRIKVMILGNCCIDLQA
jgi:hypothetical protein